LPGISIGQGERLTGQGQGDNQRRYAESLQNSPPMGSMMLDPIVSDPKRERTSGWTWRVLRRIQAIAITATNDQGFALRAEGPPLLELLQT